MADASHSDLTAQFTGVTGTNAERAKFYLESAAWNLEIALSSFYDAGDGGGDGEIEEVEIPAAMPQDQQLNKAAAEPARTRPRIATLNTIRKDASGSSSDEEGQAFYAGGSVHSGQQVIGPSRKKADADRLVETMFKAAKEHGAESVDGEPSVSHGNRGPSFRGAGYRLGETEDAPSTMVQGSDDTGGAPKQMDVVLKLWKNGFSVDDQEVRDYHDPANKEFLSSIHRGEIPHQLLRLAKGGEVNLNMEDHRGEEFVQSRRTVKAFTGEGYKLGSPARTWSVNPLPQRREHQPGRGRPPPKQQYRIVAKFNHSNTVADVRTYIITARPQFTGTTFVLMTTFPSTELTDETQTLAAAKVLNAVLVQRLK